MVNNNTGMLAMRLVRSKLRKRDDQNSDCTKNNEIQEQRHDDNQTRANVGSFGTQTTMICKDDQHVTFLRTSGFTAEPPGPSNGTDISEWTFPPKAPVPHLYQINPESLVANEKTSFKGFRKQFSGRFKRLVARKFEPAPVIPPELKPQLKTIYVY